MSVCFIKSLYWIRKCYRCTLRFFNSRSNTSHCRGLLTPSFTSNDFKNLRDHVLMPIVLRKYERDQHGERVCQVLISKITSCRHFYSLNSNGSGTASKLVIVYFYN